ncbi:MAG: hypothetical protein O3B35_04985 [Proteobacteria bacterium]|nr:hypothetical protein [Pseudomonadota bacterium]
MKDLTDKYFNLLDQILNEPSNEARIPLVRELDNIHAEIKILISNEQENETRLSTEEHFKFIQIIEKYDGDKLSNFFCILTERILDNKRSQEELKIANTRIELIKLEWIKRRKEGIYLHKPQKGLLSAMGYHVGETNGLKEKYRRLRLLSLLRGPIPYIGGPDYMEQWGDDGAAKRYNKLINVLNNLLFKAKNFGWLKAENEWGMDINWLEKKFSDKLSLNQKEMIAYIDELIQEIKDKD